MIDPTPAPGRLSRLTRRREDLDPHRGESRMAAYVYGTVLVLSAVVGASPGAVRSGVAVTLVVGTVLSTYLAHVLAHSIGSLVGSGDERATRRHLRDAVPSLTSGITPVVLLGATALGWLPTVLGQALAAAVGLVRVGGVGIVYRRLQADVEVRTAWAVGLVAAAVATLVVVVKLTLTH